MSQTAVGNRLEVGKSMVSAYENAKSLPSAEGLFKLCELFSVSLDDLVFSDLTQTYTQPERTDQVEEPNQVSNASLVRMLTQVEEELYQLKQRIRREAPELAQRWNL